MLPKGFKQAYEGRHSFDAARLSLEHLQSGALGMDEVDVGKRKGAILLTDESGLTETAIFHQELAAVIVLRNSVRASMHVNPKYQEELEWTVPELLQSTSWTLMTSG